MSSSMRTAASEGAVHASFMGAEEGGAQTVARCRVGAGQTAAAARAEEVTMVEAMVEVVMEEKLGEAKEAAAKRVK